MQKRMMKFDEIERGKEKKKKLKNRKDGTLIFINILKPPVVDWGKTQWASQQAPG